MSRSASSRFDHITSKLLIQSGSPDLYQLKPKEENIGTLKRKTLGEKDPNMINKTVLLVGETGSGKSALVNALVNYTIGVRFEDEIWFKIIDEEEKVHTESQTSDVMVYEIFGFEGQTLPFSLTIIDTPGFGDTRGTERDVMVSQKLLDLFHSDDGVKEINAVALVLKSTENRLSDRLRYIFNSVVSLFGANMEKNIVALITHSNGLTPDDALQALKDANIKCAKDEEGETVHFMFDNVQTKERTKKNKVALTNAWTLTENQMGEFTEFLKKTAPQKLEKTTKVLRRRIRLTACIQNLQERIQTIELKKKEIQQTQEQVKKHEEEMEKTEGFTIEVDEVYKEKEDIGGGNWLLGLFSEGAVTCSTCQENCHYPGCTMAWYAGHCQVMKGGRCTSCTGKCRVSAHVKEKKKYVTKTRKVQKTLQDLKEKYEDGKAANERKVNVPQALQDLKEKYENSKAATEKEVNVLQALEDQIKDLERDKSGFLDEAYQHVLTLEVIALSVVSVSTHVHLDVLIEEMEKRGDAEKVQTLKGISGRADPGVKAAMRYVWRGDCSKFT